MGQQSESNAWLLHRSGPSAGARYPLKETVTRVGRHPGNDLVLEGSEAAGVSSRHLEIRKEGNGFCLYDRNSTNGTYMNGKRVAEAILEQNSVISLGLSGPQLVFQLDVSTGENIEATAVLPASPTTASGVAPEAGPGPIAPQSADSGDLITDAVRRARLARLSGKQDQTVVIMREALGVAIRRSSKKFKVTIGALALALVGVAGYAAWAIQDLKREKRDIDTQIGLIEERLRRGAQDPGEIDALIGELNRFQESALALQRNMLYQLGVRSSEHDFVEDEIRILMAEFGAEVYSIPPEFLEQVNRFILQYQNRDEKHMIRALGRARGDLETMRSILQSENLPPDLAYIVLVESAFITENASNAGALGLWQFTAATAKAYGLEINENLDERLDIEKSTRAASRYIRDLILDFGAGSSVMLALAAYNLGPGRVKQAVRKIQDPIKQRNFWYLYRIRALPAETREYVPKIFAAIIIGRNPEKFGF